jgi:hypothetical protein
LTVAIAPAATLTPRGAMPSVQATRRTSALLASLSRAGARTRTSARIVWSAEPFNALDRVTPALGRKADGQKNGGGFGTQGRSDRSLK